MNDLGQFTSKDLRILELEEENSRLKECISAFKKYDNERKLYYANKLVELGQLQSYIQELEESPAQKIKTLRQELSRLNKVLLRYKAAELKPENEAMQIQRMSTLIGENAKLRSENQNLRESNKNLIYKLYHESN